MAFVQVPGQRSGCGHRGVCPARSLRDILTSGILCRCRLITLKGAFERPSIRETVKIQPHYHTDFGMGKKPNVHNSGPSHRPSLKLSASGDVFPFAFLADEEKTNSGRIRAKWNIRSCFERMQVNRLFFFTFPSLRAIVFHLLFINKRNQLQIVAIFTNVSDRECVL